MREGIYWRRNHRVPHLQEDDDDPIEVRLDNLYWRMFYSTIDAYA